MLLVLNDHRGGEVYCFCNTIGQRCGLCKMYCDFSNTDKKGEGRLEQFQHDLNELKKLAAEI